MSLRSAGRAIRGRALAGVHDRSAWRRGRGRWFRRSGAGRSPADARVRGATRINVLGYSAVVRDDLFELTRAQQRQARIAWRQASVQQRREAVRLAQSGSPAPDPDVSAAARAYGEYLLRKNRSNRVPRSMQPVVATLTAVVGVLLCTGVVRLPGGLAAGILLTIGGLMVVLIGLASWAQRKAARLLVAANAPKPPPSET